MGVYGNGNERKPRKESKGAGNSAWSATIFIRCELVKADEAQLEALISAGELALERTEELAADGYKYGIGADNEHKRFVATLTDKSTNSPFHNHCVSASGATPADARAAVLYKHYYKLAGDWANATVRDVSRWA